jgi:hypothetical protein
MKTIENTEIRTKKTNRTLIYRFDNFEKRLINCEEFKDRQVQFLTQYVLMILGIFSILLATLIGFSINWDFGTRGVPFLIGIGIYLSSILTIWFILWFAQMSRTNKITIVKKA